MKTSYNFTTLLMLIFNITSIAGTPKSEKHFKIITNFTEVEKKAVKYAKSKDTLKGKLLQTVVKWGSFLATDICQSSQQARIEFCRKALNADYYGFEFDLNDYQYSPCKPHNFITKSVIHFEEHPFQVNMFSCPPVSYEDMETNSKVLLPYTYAVSRGNSHDSAFTFVQEESSNINYPFQYIKKINFKKLEVAEEPNKLPAMKPLTNVIRHIFSTIPLEKLLGLQTNAKHMSKIYEKFLSKFYSLNICGLPLKHKISLCRKRLEMASHPTFDYLFVGGYHAKCQRHPINIITKNGSNDKALYVLLCPPPVIENGLMVTLIESRLNYISSTVYKYSTTLFNRRNEMKGEKLQPIGSYNHQSQFITIKHDIQRDRFLPYPSENVRMNRARQKSFEIITDMREINLLQWSPRRKVRSLQEKGYDITRINEYFSDPKSCSLVQAAWLAEDLIISFSKIKKITQVYRRFMKTYRSNDLCKLSSGERQNICRQISIFIDSRKYKEANWFATGSCHRRQLILKVREVELLETDTFTMWECQSTLEHYSTYNYKYYVGKTLLSNIAVFYKTHFFKNQERFDRNIINKT